MAQTPEEFRQVTLATKSIHELISDPEVEKAVAKAFADERRAPSVFAGLPSLASVARAQGEAPVPPPPEDP
jgi:hypothetical protein